MWSSAMIRSPNSCHNKYVREAAGHFRHGQKGESAAEGQQRISIARTHVGNLPMEAS